MRMLLFVRHVQARKHTDFSSIQKLLVRPFESSGSSSMGGSDESVFEIPGFRQQRSRQTMWIARFPKQKWLSVNSADISAKKIMAANEHRTRLEFAVFEYGDSTVRKIQIYRGGTLVCALSIDGKTFDVEGDDEVTTDLDTCRTADSALKKLRKHYGLGASLKSVIEIESAVQVISENGRVLKPQVCGLLNLDGPTKKPKNPKSSAKLKKALKARKVRDVRQAISEGASLERLPNEHETPIQYALRLFPKKGGEECAQALIDAGADLGTAFEVVFDNVFFSEEQSLRIAEFLIKNEVDLNDSSCRNPPLLSAVLQQNVKAVELLVRNGASTDIYVSWKEMGLIPWIRERFETSIGQDEKQLYAEMLTALTGNKTVAPKPAKLSKKLQRENERFRIGLEAMALLNNISDNFQLESTRKNYLKEDPKSERLEADLTDLGFKKCGQFIDPLGTFIIAFANTKENLDAVICHPLLSDLVGCRVFGSGENENLFSVYNFELLTEFKWHVPFLVEERFANTRPKRLLKEIKQLAREYKTKLKPTPAKSFAKRYESGSERILAAMPDAIEKGLAKGQIKVGKVPARFERRRFYLDVSSWDDPSYSSQRMAESRLEDVNDPNALDDVFDASMVVRAAYDLLVMQHFQFAGAPKNNDFLDRGIDIGTELFRRLKTSWKRDLEFGHWEELTMALLLCQAKGDDDRFVEICNQVSAKMASKSLRHAGEASLEFGEAILVMASYFRTKAIPKIKDLRAHVMKGRRPRPKCLIRAVDALNKSDSEEFAETLAEAIQHFLDESGRDKGVNNMRAEFAHPESILRNAAVKSGMSVDLPLELEDFMIAL